MKINAVSASPRTLKGGAPSEGGESKTEVQFGRSVMGVVQRPRRQSGERKFGRGGGGEGAGRNPDDQEAIATARLMHTCRQRKRWIRNSKKHVMCDGWDNSTQYHFWSVPIRGRKPLDHKQQHVVRERKQHVAAVSFATVVRASSKERPKS